MNMNAINFEQTAPSISSSAMLVEINRKKWNGYAVNKDATEKVQQDYNAGRKSAQIGRAHV